MANDFINKVTKLLKNEAINQLMAIKFVICDDNIDDLERLYCSVNEYITLRGLCGEVFRFSSPENVLNFSEDFGNSSIVIYILDVIMSKVDGIELGRKIREKDKVSAVIYISSSKEYSLDAFSVRAFSYLIKPFSNEKLFSELDEIVNRFKTEEHKLTIKTTNRTVVKPLSEIVAVEYFNHRLIYHLTNGEKLEGIYRKPRFDVQAEELIRTGEFLKVSASFLVNCRNIQGIKADEFIMCNGSHYKITRKYIAARQEYLNSEMSR